MTKTTTNIAVLIGIILGVHFLYTMWIIPEVNYLQMTAKETGDLLPRNFYIIVKDIEQEIAIILFLWGIYLTTSKFYEASSRDYLLVLTA